MKLLVTGRAGFIGSNWVRSLPREWTPVSILNPAADRHVDRSVQDPAPFLRIDVLGVRTLRDAAREAVVPRFVQEVISALGGSEDLNQFVADRPGHDQRYAMDCSRASAELGWSPPASFDSGLLRTLDWYRGQWEGGLA